jgi:hypothetical protein
MDLEWTKAAATLKLDPPRGGGRSEGAEVVVVVPPRIELSEGPASVELTAAARGDREAALLGQLEAGLLTALRGGERLDPSTPACSRVTVQLHPPDLGSVAIAVESREGRLSAHFHASHQLVHAWIESQAPALRSHLAEAGLMLHEMTLSTSSHQGEGESHQDAFPRPAEPPWEMQGNPTPAPALLAMMPGLDGRAIDFLA